MFSFDPIQAVLELPIGVPEARCEAGTQIEVTTYIHRNRSRGKILGHVDAQINRVNGFGLRLIRGRTEHRKDSLIEQSRTEGVGVVQGELTGVLFKILPNVIRNISAGSKGVSSRVVIVEEAAKERMFRVLGPVDARHPHVSATGARRQ